VLDNVLFVDEISDPTAEAILDRPKALLTVVAVALLPSIVVPLVSMFVAPLGTGSGYALTRALRDQGVSPLAMPYCHLALMVVLVAIAGVGASNSPARRAARLNVLQAIAAE
jgi:putative ABC transport system permease protein